MSSSVREIAKRKKDHLKFALSASSQIGSSGFDRFKFLHNALPEVDFNKIDTSTSFLGKKVNFPFFISSMTGGVEKGHLINVRLAKAAEKFNIPMGVGSQRIAVEHPKLSRLFKVRRYAPHAILMSNVGLVQLNYGFGIDSIKKVIDMIEADALIFHLNPIQEAVQSEGDTNWSGLLTKLEKIIKKIDIPVIVKEVGFGLSYDVVKRFYEVGVRIFDTAGWGGTNWAMVEGLRGKADRELGVLFSGWGIPTAQSIIQAKSFKDYKKDNKIVILGSGGIRNGIEIAKALSLGSDMAGIAMPFAKAALKGDKEIDRYVDKLVNELKIAMLGLGTKDIVELKKEKLQEI